MLDTGTADVLGLLYMQLWELPIVIVMSCIIGAFGSLFIALNSTIVYQIRHHMIPEASRFRCGSLLLGSVRKRGALKPDRSTGQSLMPR